MVLEIIGGAVTAREVQVYFEEFKEEAGILIASGLKGLYEEGTRLVFHAVPDTGVARQLQLYGKKTVTITLEEYADYRDLPSIEPSVIKAEVKSLALMFAESYLSNVRNAYIKNGRLRGFSERLHVTDWESSLKLHVMEYERPDVQKAGWCAFHYKFAAAKLPAKTE